MQPQKEIKELFNKIKSEYYSTCFFRKRTVVFFDLLENNFTWFLGKTFIRSSLLSLCFDLYFLNFFFSEWKKSMKMIPRINWIYWPTRTWPFLVDFLVGGVAVGLPSSNMGVVEYWLVCPLCQQLLWKIVHIFYTKYRAL